MSDKVVLAYSGGLDTSVAIRWLQEKYGMEVVTFTADLGNDPDLEAIRQRALSIGAAKALVADVREEFVRDFVFPALKAGAVYEGEYPLATALARPLIARHLAEAARQEGAMAVAHGCTGKGNDQVRFDVSVGSLAAAMTIPVMQIGTRQSLSEVAFGAALTALVVVRHRANIARLRRGRELRVGHRP